MNFVYHCINIFNLNIHNIKHIPVFCPSCQDPLIVTRLKCGQCETEVGGHYPLPSLLTLSPEDQAFVLQFLLTSGSLKEMARHLGVSYPTVRNRLNEIIRTLTPNEPFTS
jgi:hypothetical protein